MWSARGKGTKHLPQYHCSTPDTVWDYYGFTKEQLASGDFNPQMFNSFLDGTKSALEMAAVANGCGLTPSSNGLAFPPCGTPDLPQVLKPRNAGGHTVQALSSHRVRAWPLNRIHHAAWRPTGQTQTWAGDVVATAKRDLKAGEKLDGEGGFMVYGKLMRAQDSLQIEGLLIGLAHGVSIEGGCGEG